jgi:hypothetical protein
MRIGHGIPFVPKGRISAILQGFAGLGKAIWHIIAKGMTMPTPPTDELYWLTLSCLLTGLLWVPYILQLIAQLGPVQAIWDPTGAHPHDADWALRAKRAH